jgi:hypothetical protein
MFRHPLIALLSFALMLVASSAGAGEGGAQGTQDGAPVGRAHRSAPAAVLRPVEAAPSGPVRELLANSDLLPRKHIDRLPKREPSLRPDSVLDAARPAIAVSAIAVAPRVPDRWPASARLYTVANRGP